MKNKIIEIDIWHCRGIEKTMVEIFRKDDTYHEKKAEYYPTISSTYRLQEILDQYTECDFEVTPYINQNWVGFHLRR